ncbi:MAG: aminomethyl-transferring glycine dehydrogenase, partial [Sphingobacteriia bacterium]
MNLFEQQSTQFQRRHIGPNAKDLNGMLDTIQEKNVESLISKTVPDSIRIKSNLDVPAAISEFDYLQQLKIVASKNKVYKNYIGQGYYGTITPSVILRNIFENPGWYTQYTPYQAEISQGRLESLLNFQTLVTDLTGLPMANASLLDEATAAAEAMAMLFHQANKTDNITKPKLFVDEQIFPQTKLVLITRAAPIGIEIVTGDYLTASIDSTYFGAILQYPANNGSVNDYRGFINKVHEAGAYVIMATDLLALTLLTPPGELGADVAIGSAQRFGVPMGYGGPHAAFFATNDDFKRGMPGRLIGVSIDAQGNRALRMALQTREQHIKREKATSNICTAQALLANMAAMYAVYHGAEGLKNIAQRVHLIANAVAQSLTHLGLSQNNKSFFDTLHISGVDAAKTKTVAEQNHTNFRYFEDGTIGISIDETTTIEDANTILKIFETVIEKSTGKKITTDSILSNSSAIIAELSRTSAYLAHPVFNTHHSESQMMRYIKQLENKDLSLNTSMISLGSCTMKLNAATEMIPVSWPEFGGLHPLVPMNQTEGYQQILKELNQFLCAVTGFTACSLQPNSGAQGEYAGLLTIRAYHQHRNELHRNIVLIPISAHGTNPASA